MVFSVLHRWLSVLWLPTGRIRRMLCFHHFNVHLNPVIAVEECTLWNVKDSDHNLFLFFHILRSPPWTDLLKLAHPWGCLCVITAWGLFLRIEWRSKWNAVGDGLVRVSQSNKDLERMLYICSPSPPVWVTVVWCITHLSKTETYLLVIIWPRRKWFSSFCSLTLSHGIFSKVGHVW